MNSSNKMSKSDYQFARSIVHDLLKLNGSDRALRALESLQSGILPDKEAIPVDCAPSDYLTSSQADALWSKNPWIIDGASDKANVAWVAFLDTEQKCLMTNRKFSDWTPSLEILPDLRNLLYVTKYYVGETLREFEMGPLGFGPGSSSNCKGWNSNLIWKLSAMPECSRLAYPYLRELIAQSGIHYGISSGLYRRNDSYISQGERPTFLEHNTFSTVPKNAWTDRGICIEPHGNMLVQKAIGHTIRRRLLHIGYDLNNLSAKHGDMARYASIDDSLSTIDLASASDTISKHLVRFLVPDDWWSALKSCRSPNIVGPDGERRILEKLSSMGNGFTFELETLIFLCMAKAVRKVYGSYTDTVSVYGDDIIITRALAAPLIELLECAGFSVNTDKTFVSGPFKESCGKDYHSGMSVRPIFVRPSNENRNEFFYALANRVLSISARLSFDVYYDKRYLRVWRRIINRIPEKWRTYGPSAMGDSVINTPIHLRHYWKTMKSHGTVLIRTHQLKAKSKVKLSADARGLAGILYGITSTGIVPRGSQYYSMYSTRVLINNEYKPVL